MNDGRVRTNPKDGMGPNNAFGFTVQSPFAGVGSGLKRGLFKMGLEEAFVGFHP
jgi:hypothetical protein